METFERCGVAFISITQGDRHHDLDGPADAERTVSFAQFEREISSERTRDKMRAAQAGRGSSPAACSSSATTATPRGGGWW